MEKSFVGDPILWPGLVYSPLNNAGLIFALGAAAKTNGLLFEEFSSDFRNAICRRYGEHGWERLRVAFSHRSSTYTEGQDDIDLLICWIDDGPENPSVERLELSGHAGQIAPTTRKVAGSIRSILPDGAARDLLERGHSRESYEDSVKMLDDQIKKLQNG
jgi:hypothetical protein